MVRAAASIAILTAVVALGATEARPKPDPRRGARPATCRAASALILGSQKATAAYSIRVAGANER